MKKQLQSSTTYQPNREVKVKVVNKPIYDGESKALIGYDARVTITYEAIGQPQELTFADVDEISDFVANIDFDEPQQSLFDHKREA